VRLVWHIVWKDLRRLWPALGCWALLLIAKGEVGAWALRSDQANTDQLFVFQLLEYTLLPMEVLVSIALAGALIQEDSLVDTQVYWATRPIGGRRLLAAKLLGAVLMFGLLPLVIALRWWLVCGYGISEMGRAALALADGQATVIFPALVLAALTKNLNQFLGRALGLVVALFIWGFGSALLAEATRAELTRGVLETSGVLLVALVAAGGAAVLWLQFTRRQARTGTRLALVVLGLGALARLAAWDFSALWQRAPRAPEQARGITVAVERVQLEGDPKLDYVLRGVPPGLVLGAEADHFWRWNDGTTAKSRSGFSLGGWQGATEWRALGLKSAAGTALSEAAYVTAGPGGDAKRDGIVVPLGFFLWGETRERLQAEPSTYTGELRGQLWRPTLEWELPLNRGEVAKHGAHQIWVHSAEWTGSEWQMTMIESRPAWLRYGQHRPAIATLFGPGKNPANGFALVNRERGEAIKVWAGGRAAATLLVGTQEVAWLSVRCKVPRTELEEKSGDRPQWLDGAKLAVVRYEEEARFDRTVTVERFGAPGAADK
jgi:hypothetical protein